MNIGDRTEGYITEIPILQHLVLNLFRATVDNTNFAKMPSSLLADRVLIKLNVINPPTGLKHPQRNIFLTQDEPRVSIGRTSKRNSNYEAKEGNGWFDSAVMSRDHAVLVFDYDKQMVCVKDTNSLHGTFKNDVSVSPETLRPLKEEDILRFGVPIEKGTEVFSPCIMEVQLKFGARPPNERPIVFRVPDDSDIAISSDEEDFSLEAEEDIQIEHSSQILRANNIRATASQTSSPSIAIDLTSDLDAPIDAEAEEASGKGPDFPIAAEERIAAQVDLTAAAAPILAEIAEARRNDNRDLVVGMMPSADERREAIIQLSDFEPLTDQFDVESNSANSASPSHQSNSSNITDMEDLVVEQEIFGVLDEFESTSANDYSSPVKPYVEEVLHNETRTESAPESGRRQPSRGSATSLDQAITSQSRDEDTGRNTHDNHDYPMSIHVGSEDMMAETPTPSKQVLKRKVADMSETTSLEELQDTQFHSFPSVSSQAVETPPSSIANIGSTELLPPPRKRLRRMAEAVGFAALGGIAVISTLIATAPDL